MLQRQHSLDDTRDPGAALRVADIGLHGADVDPLITEDVPHSPCLDGVTD